MTMSKITLPGDENDPFYNRDHDPRAESEKARADLKRNEEIGLAPVESDDEFLPSVTADTFGEQGSADDGAPPVDRESRDDPTPEAL